MITEVVTELVSGLSAFLVGIARAAIDFLEVLFWDPTPTTGGLTTFGLVIILFMGIGIAYKVLGMVRSTIRA